MRRTAKIFSAWTTVFLFLAGYTLAQAPMPISPSADDGEALVISGCPSFSWSEVDDAVSYRVAIFELDKLAAPASYDELVTERPPVLDQTIPDRGLSWTPSADRCLNGGRYVWYAAAINMEDTVEWAEGKLFRVDAMAVFDADSGEQPDEETTPESGETVSAREDEKVALSLEQIISSTFNPGRLTGSYEHPDKVAVTFGEEGTSNTLYGDSAGNSLTENMSATFIGAQAGFNTTTGYSNAFVGYQAGYGNTSGYKNAFFGYGAGGSNSTGGNNTFLGHLAGHENSSGGFNTIIGGSAGRFNTEGDDNTFIGAKAGHKNTTGNRNTFLGYDVGYSNTTGIVNTFIGVATGYNNITGYSNTFVGSYSGFLNTTGNRNSFFGYHSGYSNTTGHFNTFIGNWSGRYNTTGYSNTFIGWGAGNSNTTGFGNVFIGYHAGYNSGEGSNRLYIDNSDTDKPLIYGEFDNNSVKIHGQLQLITSATSSDLRLKKDIRSLKSSLDKVTELQGVSYQWRADQFPDWGFGDAKQIGLVAQDVEAVIPELVSTDSKGYKAVSYDKLTAVLVEAIKELKAENETLKTQNDNLKAKLESEIDQQQSQIDELRALVEKLSG